MSITRQELIGMYDISDEGLKRLLNDLCSKSETQHNRMIIELALSGLYSDLGSKDACPIALLSAHLKQAGYLEFEEKAHASVYDHNFAPQPNQKHTKYRQAFEAYTAQKREHHHLTMSLQLWTDYDKPVKNVSTSATNHPVLGVRK